MNTGDYPIGARNNPLAPFNEPLNVKHKRTVVLTIMYDVEIEGRPDMSEDVIKNIVLNDIKQHNFPDNFSIEDAIIEK